VRLSDPQIAPDGRRIAVLVGRANLAENRHDTELVLSTRRYDAWGNLELGYDQPGYAFTGREWDPETGLYYYRARYYDPLVGRFISEDPIGFAAGVNFYAYALGAPTVFTDSDGLAVETPWDVANVAIGVTSLAANVAAGNVGGALLDAFGLAVDLGATAIPGLPGGAGAAIQAYRGSKLARAMYKAARPVAKGLEQAHHVVARTSKAFEARRRLKKCGIDIDDAANGARLANRFHRGLHTDEYYDAINQASRRWDDEASARQGMEELARRLEQGDLPY